MGLPLSPVIANFFMEHFQEMTGGGNHRTFCWFCYVDDTSVIQPHRSGKPSEFPDHRINVHGHTQVTMKMKGEGHLPFLDINIYYKPDGSVGQKVYRKHTHANLYLNSNTHHHPCNKQAVLTILMIKPDPFVTGRASTANWNF
jgi:hypothetical protein